MTACVRAQDICEYGGPRLPLSKLREAGADGAYALELPKTRVFIDGNYDNSPFKDGALSSLPQRWSPLLGTDGAQTARTLRRPTPPQLHRRLTPCRSALRGHLRESLDQRQRHLLHAQRARAVAHGPAPAHVSRGEGA